jgi:hypothetical protein
MSRSLDKLDLGFCVQLAETIRNDVNLQGPLGLGSRSLLWCLRSRLCVRD